MSTTASVNFKTEFDPLVHHAYQGESKLLGKVRTRMNVNGKTYSFPKMGKGVAQLRIPQSDVVPMNITHTATTVTLYDYDASEYSAIEDLDKLAFDEKMELVKLVAKAIGRRIDQSIIDAMAASAFATQVSDDEGGTNSSLNIEKIVKAHELLTANGVPMEGRYLALNAKALAGALQETEIGSSDFNVTRALATGEIKTYAGFEFITFEDRTEGGIPLSTSNVRNCFAFHKDAVGLAMTGGVKSEVNYIPEKKSWLISSGVSLGAVTIDTDGVIDVLTYEA
jgi:hypothetical protein